MRKTESLPVSGKVHATIRPSVFSAWIYSRWRSSSVLPKVARTKRSLTSLKVIDRSNQIILVSVNLGPFSTARCFLYGIEDLRHDDRISRPSLHLQLVDSQTLAAQPLAIHTTPSWTLFVYTFRAEGRLFIQEFAVKTAKRHGPRKKGGSHTEKKPTCFFFTRRSKEPNVVEAVKMKGSQKCGDVGSEPMDQRLLWSTKIIHQRRLKTGKHEKQQQNVNQGLRCEEFWASSPEGLS